jgi:selenocysteine-specific translation elongation factor
MHLTVGIFGDQELAKRLGKKGTTNDIAIYNHGSSEGVLTYVCPNSEKIQPLLQVLNMIDVPVIAIKGMTKEIGEILIGIDEMKFKKGFIITDVKETVQQFIKGTSLENFEFTDERELRTKLLETKIERGDETEVPIDNYFNVKGIGTVILGMVRNGKVNLHDKLFIEPLGREVTVKGIQSQDKDIKETEPGMRVGLNLKGVEVDEIKRGFVLCKSTEKSNEIKIRFSKNKFFKQEISKGMQVFLSVGLQMATCNVETVDEEMVLKSNQIIAYRKNQICLLASQNDIMPRIIGSGIIT